MTEAPKKTCDTCGAPVKQNEHGEISYGRAEVQRLVAEARAERTTVKPLVWQYDSLEVDLWNESRTSCRRVTSSEHWVASPPHMAYEYGIVRLVDPRLKPSLGVTLTRGLTDTRYPSVEAAKAAAQADYERRILSALSDAPPRQVTPQEAATVRTLKDVGYAPGDYMVNCVDCPQDMSPVDRLDRTADKRAWRCKEHAEAALRALANGGDSDG